LIIQTVTSNGAQVAPNDDEKWSRWVWEDQVVNALRQIQSDAFPNDYAQLTTGITVTEQDAVDLLNLITKKKADRYARQV